ncbi:MAG TPA: hypothetical protein VKB84_20075 [Candidatus Binataceae bacterium]|nr:hypothetical protein [Candidatus Binataceae bacterium]
MDEWWNVSNCPAECQPGLSLRWGVCRTACPGTEIAGVCCGDVGEIACITSPNCASGLSVADPTIYDPEFLANCVPPPIPAKTELNGSDQRPFYVVAHNPNDKGLLDNDLMAGANALEPDITLASDGPCLKCITDGETGCTEGNDYTAGDGAASCVVEILDNKWVYTGASCVAGTDVPTAYLVDFDSSSPYRQGRCSDTHFARWLDYVHGLASQSSSKLAMIAFDIKTSVADGKHVKEIQQAVKSHLTDGLSNPNLTVIYSVGSKKDATSAFGGTDFTNDDLVDPNEGVQIDGETDPSVVYNFFVSLGYTKFGYGDGTALQSLALDPTGVQPRSQDYGVFLRASTGLPKILSYEFLLATDSEWNFYIDLGVDGIIPGTIGTDIPVGCTIDNFKINNCEPPDDPTQDVAKIKGLLTTVGQHPEIRLATRSDNPFQAPLQSAYGLEVTTDAANGSGTDANLVFTLNGCKGSATITINTGDVIPRDALDSSGRMEAGHVDHVTIPSKDLGVLASITISNDGTGIGPEWTFDSIKISSAKWMPSIGGVQSEYQTSGTTTVGAFKTVTLPLTSNFTPGFDAPSLPDVIAQCSAPLPAAPIARQSCAGSITGTTTVTGPFGQGDWVIPWTFTDSTTGISKVRDQAVHVHDTMAPTPTLASLPNVTAQCSAVLPAPPTATDNCPGPITVTPSATGPFGQGDFTIVWTFADGVHNLSTESQAVNVHDTIPPVISSVSASPNVLWSPNHKFVPVQVTAVATDNCDPAPVCTLIGIASSEPPSDSNSPDFAITGPLSANLRAERDGTGTGRTYTLTVQCTDNLNNKTQANTTVFVPHNQ